MLSRQELYDLMWSEPAKTIAPRFGFSDVALAKLCTRHDIPQPPRGYWAKVAAGKRGERIPLPPRGLGMEEYIQRGSAQWGYRNAPSDLADMEIGPPPVFPEGVADLTARVRKVVGRVTVPRDLGQAHHAIQALLDVDEQRRAAQTGKTYLSFFDALYFDSPFEKRRLRLMNALLLALGRQGARPSLSRKKDPDDISVTVGHQSMTLVVDEPRYQRSGWRTRSDANKPASTELSVSLSVSLDDAPTAWKDAKGHRVEDQITDIVVGVLVAGELAYRKRERSHHAWLIERKAQLIEELKRAAIEAERKERERRIALEKARVQRLLADAKRHRQAADIRTYVAAVAASKALFDGDATKREEWIAWALDQADGIDPLVKGDVGDVF